MEQGKWIEAQCRVLKKRVLLTLTKPFETIGMWLIGAVEVLERIISKLENAAE